MTIREQFDAAMKADGWELENGEWHKTVLRSDIDLRSMSELSNTVNAKPFNAALPHTLRLLGPSWTRQADNQYLVTYRILPHEDLDGTGFDLHPCGKRIAVYRETDFENVLPA